MSQKHTHSLILLGILFSPLGWWEMRALGAQPAAGSSPASGSASGKTQPSAPAASHSAAGEPSGKVSGSAASSSAGSVSASSMAQPPPPAPSHDPAGAPSGSASTTAAAPSAGSAHPDLAKANDELPPPPTCASEPDTEDEAHVDVDLTSGGSVTRVPPRSVVLPNQGLVVRICRTASQKVTSVQWGGTRGLTASTSANNASSTTPDEKSLLKKKSESQTEAPPPIVQDLRFSPRQSGPADLAISYTDAASATPDQAIALPTIELDVDTLYWGSIRVGLGSLFDVNQNWQTYSIQTFAGSFQPEIRKAHSGVGFEIVSGFAPYLLDLFACPRRGRSYTGGCDMLFAPFVGFGVLGTNSTGVQALSSFHAGIELEFANSFSVAVTAVVRRMQALANGYVVGSPVAGGMQIQDVTRDAWSPGLGVVINATPSFLQFAMPSGSGGSNKKP